MFVNVAIVNIAPGREAEFEAMSGQTNADIRRAPGFVSRQLLRDQTHPGRYFYISTWRSKADIDNYRASEAVVAQKMVVGGSQIMVGPHDQSDCAIVIEECA